jgi:PAS domain S-box-containing protein
MHHIDLSSRNELFQSLEILDEHVIVSVADQNGLITYVNDKFCKISGYSREELLGQNHRLLKSTFHPPEFYQDLWSTISSGKIWSGEICNCKESGELYWVKASIKPFLDSSGTPYKYVSYRTDISDIKQQQQAHLALLNATAECIHGLDHDGYCVFINPAATKTLGFEDKELLGHKLHDIIHHHKEDGTELLESECAVFKTLRDQQIRHCEDWFIRKDGSGFPAETIIAPRFENNQFVGVLLSYHDITLRRLAETELKESQERLRVALDGAESGVWDWNIKTGELYWSDNIPLLFGYGIGELKTSFENFINHIHPDDKEAVEKAIQESVSSGAPYEIEHRIIKPNGEVHWLLEKGAVFLDPENNAEKMLGTVTSIQKRKLAEKKLKETEERNNIAIEGANNGVWDWDLNSGQVLVTDIFAEMLGYTKEELTPFSLERWVEMMHPDDQESSKHLVQEHLDGHTQLYENTFRLKCKDGQWMWILSRGKVVSFDKIGKPSRMTGIHADISKLKQLEFDLQQTKDYAEQANQAKSAFLSSMSHELRTPLNAILGFSQLLAMDPELPLAEAQKEYVSHIFKGGKHLLSLIDEVLQLSAIEAGKVKLNIQNISLTDVVEETILLTQTIADLKKVQVTSSIPESFVKADELKLKQVLLNLLSNSIKYNCEGGNVTIDCSIIRSNHIKINVIDTGIGIDESVQHKVFSAFNRLGQESSEIEGTGIGLVVTKGLVELMDGSIGFDSQINKGTTFWIILPLAETINTESPIAERISTNMTTPVNIGNSEMRHILYVEDNSENSDLMKGYFDMLPGLQLYIVETAESGLEILAQEHFDLILMDINLPGIDGITLTEYVKSVRDYSHIPVVAITANAMPEDIEKTEKIFDSYLTKPIDFQVLASELRHYFQSNTS